MIKVQLPRPDLSSGSFSTGGEREKSLVYIYIGKCHPSLVGNAVYDQSRSPVSVNEHRETRNRETMQWAIDDSPKLRVISVATNIFEAGIRSVALVLNLGGETIFPGVIFRYLGDYTVFFKFKRMF